MTEDDWDSVIRVHLKGTFACSRWAATYWRERSKGGHSNDARIINTTSGSGLFGTAGQANYGAAKAGLAGLTIIAAMELERYGVTVNAISPIALTRMTEGLALTQGDGSEQAKSKVDPRWVAVLTSWLASTQSAGVTGRVFQVSGRVWAVAHGWHRGPSADPVDDPHDVDAVIRKLLSEALPNAGRRHLSRSLTAMFCADGSGVGHTVSIAAIAPTNSSRNVSMDARRRSPESCASEFWAW